MARSIARLLAICVLCLPLLGQDYGSGIPMVYIQPTAGEPLSALIFGHLDNNTPSVAGTVYLVVSGGMAILETNEDFVGQIISTPGTFTNIRLKRATDIGTSGDNEILTLRLDTGSGPADTALTCTISGGAGNEAECEDPDAPESVAVSAGDIVSLTLVSEGTPVGRRIGWSLHFTSDNTDEQNLLSHYDANHTSGTRYGPIGGFNRVGTATVFNSGLLTPISGTIKNLRVEGDVCPGVGDTRVYTVQIDGVDTGLSCTLSGTTPCGDAGTDECFDTAESPVPVSAGGYISLEDEVTAGTPASMETHVGLTFVTDTTDKFIFGSTTSNSTNQPTTERIAVTGTDNIFSGSSTAHQVPVVEAFTVTDMDVQLATAPGTGEDWVVTVLEGGSGTTAACTVDGTDTTCNPGFSGTEPIADNSLIDIQFNPSASPADTVGAQVGFAGTVP